MKAEQKVAPGIALMFGSIMLSILGCFLIYAVWNIHERQVNREMVPALVRYAKVVSSMVPAPSFVIGPAPQPWYLTLFYLGMTGLILWSLSGVLKGLARKKTLRDQKLAKL